MSETPWRIVSSSPFEPGESVYAIAPHPLFDALAVGTRSGKVLFVQRANSEDKPEPYEMKEICRGKPVLSLSWVDETLLAVSDSEGNCFLYDTASSHARSELETEGAAICSLLALNGHCLAGLSVDGEILSWTLPDRGIAFARRGPAPPAHSALVQLTFWSGAGAVVYPAAGGRLVVCGFPEGEVRSVEAHEGDFYAVAEMGDNLATAGLEDRRLRVWKKDALGLAEEIALPKGALSMATLDTGRRMLLLVDESGKAAAYALERGILRELRRFEGEDYRIVVGPPRGILEQVELDRIEAEAASLMHQLEEALQLGRYDDFDAQCRRLLEIGREREARKMWLAKAVARKEVLEELRSRMVLSRLSPADPVSAQDLMGLAALLEKLGLFEEALAARERAGSMAGGDSLSFGMDQTAERARAAESGKAVFRPGEGIVVEDLLRAPNLLGAHCRGRYEVSRGAPKECQNVSLSADQVVEAYEDIRLNDKEKTLPGAEHEELIWILSTDIQRVPTVLFRNDSHDSLKGLELALRVERFDRKTLVTPLLLLNVGAFGQRASIAEHNQQALEAYRSIMGHAVLVEAWREGVMPAIVLALRRILTGSVASPFRKSSQAARR